MSRLLNRREYIAAGFLATAGLSGCSSVVAEDWYAEMTEMTGNPDIESVYFKPASFGKSSFKIEIADDPAITAVLVRRPSMEDGHYIDFETVDSKDIQLVYTPKKDGEQVVIESIKSWNWDETHGTRTDSPEEPPQQQKLLTIASGHIHLTMHKN